VLPRDNKQKILLAELLIELKRLGIAQGIDVFNLKATHFI
jgi:hypothetical protein